MSEIAELPTREKKIPPLIVGNEYADGLLLRKESFLDIEDEDIVNLISDMERVLGREFEGDINNAVILVQEYLNGMSVPITEQMSDEETKGVKFGFYAGKYIPPDYRADTFYAPRVKEAGQKIIHRATFIDIEALESYSRLDPNKVFTEKDDLGEVIYTGPVWYAFRCWGIEEGAHYVFATKNPKNAARASQKMTIAEYRAVDAEFDAAIWLRTDALQMSRNQNLSFTDRDAINETFILYDQIYREARSLRLKRGQSEDLRS